MLTVVQVYADHRGRALGQGDHRGTDHVERRHGFMTLGVGDHHGVARLLGGVERGAHGLEARCVELRDGHIVLLGDRADVTQVYQHGNSFQSLVLLFALVLLCLPVAFEGCLYLVAVLVI